MKLYNLDKLLDELNIQKASYNSHDYVYSTLKNYYKYHNVREIYKLINCNSLGNKYQKIILYKNKNYQLSIINWGENVNNLLFDCDKSYLLVLYGNIAEYVYTKNLIPIQYTLLNKGSINFINNDIHIHKLLTKNYNDEKKLLNCISTLHIEFIK